jgi:hypothetical protein
LQSVPSSCNWSSPAVAIGRVCAFSIQNAPCCIYIYICPRYSIPRVWNNIPYPSRPGTPDGVPPAAAPTSDFLTRDRRSHIWFSRSFHVGFLSTVFYFGSRLSYVCSAVHPNHMMGHWDPQDGQQNISSPD